MTMDQGVYFTLGAENVPGTLHKVPGHAVICCSVPGTLRAPPNLKYTLDQVDVRCRNPGSAMLFLIPRLKPKFQPNKILIVD